MRKGALAGGHKSALPRRRAVSGETLEHPLKTHPLSYPYTNQLPRRQDSGVLLERAPGRLSPDTRMLPQPPLVMVKLGHEA